MLFSVFLTYLTPSDFRSLIHAVQIAWDVILGENLELKNSKTMTTRVKNRTRAYAGTGGRTGDQGWSNSQDKHRN